MYLWWWWSRILAYVLPVLAGLHICCSLPYQAAASLQPLSEVGHVQSCGQHAGVAGISKV